MRKKKGKTALREKRWRQEPQLNFQMREGSGGKFDVHCFLFTDMLLVCKSLSRKGERVKVSMIMVIMMMMNLIGKEEVVKLFVPLHLYFSPPHAGDPPTVHCRPPGCC